jgi:hypothetical protein
MQEFGITVQCRFPDTGANCTENYVDQISPAIGYSTVIGMVTYAILLIPSLFISNTHWKEYQHFRTKVGTRIRLVCALSTFFAGVFSFVLFATGHCITYPSDELVGGASFIAVGASTFMYLISTTSVILMSRRLFFATVDSMPSGGTTGVLHMGLHKVKESHIAMILLLPPLVVFLVVDVLVISNAVQDNITLWRVNMCGVLMYANCIWLVTRVYGWPVVKILRDFADNAAKSSGCVDLTSEGKWRPAFKDEVNNKIRELADQLTAQLKLSDILCPMFASIFAFAAVSNALSYPQVRSVLAIQFFSTK